MYQHLPSNARDIFGQPIRRKKEKKVAYGSATAAALQAAIDAARKQMYPHGVSAYFRWSDDPMSSPPPPPPPKLDIARIDQLSGVEARKVKPKIVVPDLTACIVGWRGWRVTVSGNEYRLQGLGMDTAWEPKKPITATCESGTGMSGVRWMLPNGEIVKPKQHSCPGKECSCGVWAFRSLNEFKRMAEQYHSCVVVGEVYLWGRVLECENGFRAEKAYPKELWAFQKEHISLSWVYNVPIKVIE